MTILVEALELILIVPLTITHKYLKDILKMATHLI